MTTTNAAVRHDDIESLLAALQQCKEKQEHHKKETERLEKEEELLRAEIRHVNLRALHDRLATTNATLNERSMERNQPEHPEQNQELQAEIEGLFQARKQALLLGTQEADESRALVNMTEHLWEQLSDEERQQRGYVIAALHGSVFRHDRENRFDKLYPELSEDRAVFMARIKNESHPLLRKVKRSMVIPEPYRDDQEVILALLECCVRPSIDHVSQRLMSSRDFLAEVIHICEKKGRLLASHPIISTLLNNQDSLATLSLHPELVVSLIGHKSNGDHFATETTLDNHNLLPILDTMYAEQGWPFDVLMEWVRMNRFISDDHSSIVSLRNEISNRQGKSLLLEVVDKTEGHILKHLPPFAKFDIDVLITAMCYVNEHNSLYSKLYHGNEDWAPPDLVEVEGGGHLFFHPQVYWFGRWIRQCVADSEARRDRVDAFLNASNNFQALGLDKESTAALVEKISAYAVGRVPSAQELERLRTALVVTKDVGY